MVIIDKYSTDNVNKRGCVGMKEPWSKYIGIIKNDETIYFLVEKIKCDTNTILTNKNQRDGLNLKCGENVTINDADILDECQEVKIIIDYKTENIEMQKSIEKMLIDIPLHENIDINYYYGKKIIKLKIIPNINNTILSKSTKINFIFGDNEITKKEFFKQKFDFEELGIGGLNEEFKLIFRRAFATRLIKDKDLINKLNIKHLKGMILYGPSGTGKSLIARKISQILNCDVKIVNGPELIDKYVGESEKKVRELFEGNDNLRVIIFDEMDSICGKRSDKGSMTHNNIINQLLTQMDGITSKDNFIIIGLTNRFHMIDDALKRPGRFELHVPIGLPDEEGRLSILNIHSKKIMDLMDNVDLEQLAKITNNYSGAELEAIINNAKSIAIARNINYIDNTFDDTKNIIITNDDILQAKNEIIPNFGCFSREINIITKNNYIHPNEFIEITNLIINSPFGKQTIIMVDCITEIMAHLINQDVIKENFTYIKYINSIVAYQSYNDGFNELLNNYIKTSIIVFDSIENIISYSPLGNIYSNNCLQSINRIINNVIDVDSKSVIICTTKNSDLINKLNIFDKASYFKIS